MAGLSFLSSFLFIFGYCKCLCLKHSLASRSQLNRLSAFRLGKILSPAKLTKLAAKPKNGLPISPSLSHRPRGLFPLVDQRLSLLKLNWCKSLKAKKKSLVKPGESNQNASLYITPMQPRPVVKKRLSSRKSSKKLRRMASSSSMSDALRLHGATTTPSTTLGL